MIASGERELFGHPWPGAKGGSSHSSIISAAPFGIGERDG